MWAELNICGVEVHSNNIIIIYCKSEKYGGMINEYKNIVSSISQNITYYKVFCGMQQCIIIIFIHVEFWRYDSDTYSYMYIM